jgi:hypothetical protein
MTSAGGGDASAGSGDASARGEDASAGGEDESEDIVKLLEVKDMNLLEVNACVEVKKHLWEETLEFC